MRGAKALGIAALCVFGAAMLVTLTPLVPGGPASAATAIRRRPRSSRLRRDGGPDRPY